MEHPAAENILVFLWRISPDREPDQPANGGVTAEFRVSGSVDPATYAAIFLIHELVVTSLMHVQRTGCATQFNTSLVDDAAKLLLSQENTALVLDRCFSVRVKEEGSSILS